jgi:DNA-binding phage protein
MVRSRKSETGFDEFFDGQMASPSFAKAYTKARREVDAVDVMVRALDLAREKAGLTKAQLAAEIDARPEVVRRLFTSKKPNPTLATLVRIAAAVGYRVELVPVTRPKKATGRGAAGPLPA